jgi:hypothetical protein
MPPGHAREGRASVIGKVGVQDGGEVERSRAVVADNVAVDAIDEPSGGIRISDDVVRRFCAQTGRVPRCPVGVDVVGDDGVMSFSKIQAPTAVADDRHIRQRAEVVLSIV